MQTAPSYGDPFPFGRAMCRWYGSLEVSMNEVRLFRRVEWPTESSLADSGAVGADGC